MDEKDKGGRPRKEIDFENIIVRMAKIGLTTYQMARVLNKDLIEIEKYQEIIEKNLPINYKERRRNRFIKAMGYSTKLRDRLRQAIKAQIAQMFVREMGRIEDIIGYSPDDILINFETKFKDGMTWEGWGEEWQIDHIKPRFKFDTKNLKSCFNLNNLRPLSKKENLCRSKK